MFFDPNKNEKIRIKQWSKVAYNLHAIYLKFIQNFNLLYLYKTQQFFTQKSYIE